MAEPGRALAAPGLSAVVEVLLRKDNKLYINDGLYGVFWELRYDAHDQYAARGAGDLHYIPALNATPEHTKLLAGIIHPYIDETAF